MRLVTAPKNEAILKNVGEVGEFRIKNSAKAFQILSSGLYQNKVRAIIRELSCNAVDSHVAAGKGNVPFVVHLPTMLEPWFSVRDFGTGLTHEEVTKIYTTYFESTKTDSDAFIGALGLGSKSPFSYTDNFTVIAVKDGRRGIYSAFINDNGVPSIVLMSEEKSKEDNGVEVKFSVEDRGDFSKFSQEASATYKYFQLRPTVVGNPNFTFNDVKYIDKDIVPGVSSFTPEDYYSQGSVAVMGNIGYPIEMPGAEKSLNNDLRILLNCNLEIRFEIGELDFAASREGLSYIPHTISNIAKKLQALQDNLYSKLCSEVDAIPNYWDKHLFLKSKFEQKLWTHMVSKYVSEKKNKMVTLAMQNYGHYMSSVEIQLLVETFLKPNNIGIECISYHGGKTFTTSGEQTRTKKGKDDKPVAYHTRDLKISSKMCFVINDIERAVGPRVKNHWMVNVHKDLPPYIWILSPIDKQKPMKLDKFFRVIKNPPEKYKYLASALDVKERKKVQRKDAVVLRLKERGGDCWRTRNDLVWREDQHLSKYDPTETYYYCKLAGMKLASDYTKEISARDLINKMKSSGIVKLNGIRTIHGIRKSDLAAVKSMKNWIAIEDHVHNTLVNFTAQDFRGLLRNVVDNQCELKYTVEAFKAVKNRKSPYVRFFEQMESYKTVVYTEKSLKELCEVYAKDATNSPLVMLNEAELTIEKLLKRYPLMEFFHHVPDNKLAEYIDLIDTTKGV